MANLNKNSIKLAIQKEGRLTNETLDFLRKSGLEFESYKQKLFVSARNFPLEILYVRDDDIPDYVESGVVDLGILGQNILNEERPKVKKLLNLRFGFCSLVIAVPKESNITNVKDLKNKKIATTYPSSTKYFFKKQNIPVEIVTISGSVEITPFLGIADAIVDMTSTGSTLALNDLRFLEKLYDSEAVLIANQNATASVYQKNLIGKLIIRFKGVLSAKNYKYVLMNAPEDVLPKLKKITPGLKSPTISPLTKEGWVSVGTVIKEEVFWETVEKLKDLGATGIIVLPIEKMIT
ncbi:MAG: ATP phosphoribosyltransferase [Candidatus Levybacteria bacterium RIFCSPHIGHO2_12_FULL_38_12]|nr:MAG: ATP phosphoribosyltransferase [Candidatus Levybacteria bacterium RIFCSPHIGHO2_01_FULL_38_12]OGH22161.1 MAG: ATP phosphoribosyltransferase [Candidatus Levybacteria bacterium RIFCSPHIGHO2_02_FULL_37_18]OGH23010.1 MAG: ATP phosphoribosyltransferase [Candidatus Levybacteria bacterium RIFCSPHIGHO2_12_FULL_38_12]OGH34191.1 MAG: ATP phosphoribosyltransferase [Candidatus Levybacteria bacterium RIFCSPLOWO2_01_FULL_37_20]OGH44982.1 MAG: ATP phosphoribosyltransferase [Candidatus Levybacteria bacte